MFNSKKRFYDVYEFIETENDYGESVKDWESSYVVSMFISLSNQMTTQSNDMRIQQCSHIGLTNDSLNIGDRVDNKYEVQFINRAGRENIVYMQEIESNGYFN